MASSGLPVSYLSLTSQVCTIGGATATLVAVGLCTVVATQGGNGDYNAALEVTVSFAVAAGQDSGNATNSLFLPVVIR